MKKKETIPEPDCDRVQCITRREGKCIILTDSYEGKMCPFLCTLERFRADTDYCKKRKEMLKNQ